MDPSPLAQDDRREVSMTEGGLRLRMTREEWFWMTIPSVMLKEPKRLKHLQEEEWLRMTSVETVLSERAIV